MPERASSHEHRIAGPRLIAIFGPFQSGKTSLLESLLARGGGVPRQGSVREGTASDSSSEARRTPWASSPMSRTSTIWDDRLTFVDCPGSVEFMHDMRHVAPVCDVAVVVCEADQRKVPALQMILRELEEMKIPGCCF